MSLKEYVPNFNCPAGASSSGRSPGRCVDSVSDKRETKTNLFYHYYSIEPESLLDALSAGKVDVFSPLEEEPPSLSSDQQITVPWTQDDYLRIANALIQFARNDTLNDWNLNSMSFDLGCEEVGVGFQNGDFKFFKIAKADGREARLQLIINIRPKDRFVFITENEYYPKLTNWPSITLEENLLSAEEALQRAENAGGNEKRLSVTNACYISLLLNQNVGWWNKNWWWWAHYSQMGDEGRLTTLFSIDTNPHTGEIRP